MSGLRLLLQHPGVAKVPCSECAKRAYDLETGTVKTYKSGPEGKEMTFEGPQHGSPCRRGFTCPKESPEKESEHVLSAKNERVVLLYNHAKAAGAGAIGEIDPLLADLLSICDHLYLDSARRERQLESNQLFAALMKAK